MEAPETPAPPPAPSAGRPRLIDCPVCGGAITLRAVGHSVNAVCAQCGSLLDVAREETRVLKKAWESQRDLLIPLGARGKLEGRAWEVIGYQVRSSGSGSEGRYAWEEYLLFNPRHGFRFLAQAQGHWTLYRVMKSGMGMPPGTRFQRFFQGTARVDYVLGEFYWRVKKGDKAHVTDSVSPPYVLSAEKSDGETNLALGSYLALREVADAFGLDAGKLPRPSGIAPNQPSPYVSRLRRLLPATLVAVGIATVVQLVQAVAAGNQQAFAGRYALSADKRGEILVSEPFTLSGEQANVCLESHAELNNNWAEADVQLVDSRSQASHGLHLGMEFYSGYDGGEYWSEGDRDASGCFSALPGGEYRLVVETDSGSPSWNSAQNITLRVVRDAPIWSNWLALLLALVPYPLYLWLRHHSFEYGRWSDSDYVPDVYANLRKMFTEAE